MYLWNIDGTLEYQIYDTLNNILTCSITYESNAHTNGEAPMLLINGFSGTFKLWWDHALINKQKVAIKNHRTRIKRTIKTKDGALVTQEIKEE